MIETNCNIKSWTLHKLWFKMWTSDQMRKIAGCICTGNVLPTAWVNDPDMHHGTCVTHVPWCMSGSLTNGFLLKSVAGKKFSAFPSHAQPSILLTGKRPMIVTVNNTTFLATAKTRMKPWRHIFWDQLNGNQATRQLMFNISFVTFIKVAIRLSHTCDEM